MIAGGDAQDDAAIALSDDMENAVLTVVNVWRVRRASSAGSLGSPLAAIARGAGHVIDPMTIGCPTDFRAWLITVEICGQATREELGFDALELLAEFSRGARDRTIATARGWRPGQLRKNYDAAVTALLLEFASRGVTREIRTGTD
ncbi:MAG: hypothetical protein ACSLFQ_01555, partial [Thermoanaerobaculia bacterium]